MYPATRKTPLQEENKNVFEKGAVRWGSALFPQVDMGSSRRDTVAIPGSRPLRAVGTPASLAEETHEKLLALMDEIKYQCSAVQAPLRIKS